LHACQAQAPQETEKTKDLCLPVYQELLSFSLGKPHSETSRFAQLQMAQAVFLPTIFTTTLLFICLSAFYQKIHFLYKSQVSFIEYSLFNMIQTQDQ